MESIAFLCDIQFSTLDQEAEITSKDDLDIEVDFKLAQKDRDDNMVCADHFISLNLFVFFYSLCDTAISFPTVRCHLLAIRLVFAENVPTQTEL